MPSPTASLATLRPDLATFMEFNLAMERMGFIGQMVLPVLDVALQANPFGKITIESLLQNRETVRAPGGGYARANWQFTTDSYACQEHGAEEPIDDRQSQMYAQYFDAEQIAAMRAFDAVLRGGERRIADLVFNGTTWTGSSLKTAVTNEWDDYSNATPIDDVEGAVRKVYGNTGLWPNALIINRKVFRNLRNCDQIIERIVASGAGSPAKASDVTAEMLAAVFDLRKVLVAGGSKNSAVEGQSATPGQIWSDEYAMVARLCETNDIQEPGLGRTFHWAKDGSQIGGTVETYREEGIRGDVVRVRNDTHEKVLYTECGHLLENITT